MSVFTHVRPKSEEKKHLAPKFKMHNYMKSSFPNTQFPPYYIKYVQQNVRIDKDVKLCYLQIFLLFLAQRKLLHYHPVSYEDQLLLH